MVENGNEFTKEHFFMMLMTLDPDEVHESIIILSLRIIIEEIEITSVEYVEFNQSIKDNNLHKAYFDIRTKIFPEDHWAQELIVSKFKKFELFNEKKKSESWF